MNSLFKILLAIIFSCTQIFSQEMTGITLGNYAGTNGILLNPASMVNSKIKLDIRLLTLGIHADNNYLYSDTTNLLKFLGSDEVILLTEDNQDEGGPGDAIVRDRYTPSKKFAYVNFQIYGPALMVSGKKGSFAFHNGFRTAVSLRGLHHTMAKFAIEGLDYVPQQNENYIAKRTRINLMAWSEIGASYAKNFFKNEYYSINGGITASFLLGHGAGYYRHRLLDYQVNSNPPGQDLQINGLTGKYGYNDYETYQDDNDDLHLLKGKGAGFSIGIDYLQHRTFQPRYKVDTKKWGTTLYHPVSNYKWKFGAALIDIGGIGFGTDASRYSFENDTAYWSRIDQADISTANDFDTTLSREIYNSSNLSRANDAFFMGLPTALSLQYDYNVWNYFNIGATLVQRLPKWYAGVDRSNILAIVPRFEMRAVEVALPFVLYEYKYPRLGASFRMGGFSIGTDKLGALFFDNEFSGVDFYMSWRIFLSKVKGAKKPGENNKLQGKNDINGRRGRGKIMNCFNF